MDLKKKGVKQCTNNYTLESQNRGPTGDRKQKIVKKITTIKLKEVKHGKRRDGTIESRGRKGRGGEEKRGRAMRD